MLKERDLWLKRGLVLECPTLQNRSCCAAEGGCCVRQVLGEEREFRGQKGRLQEEVEAQGLRMLFYPNFHCELDFIERYWCEQNGLQEKIVGTTSRRSRQWRLK